MRKTRRKISWFIGLFISSLSFGTGDHPRIVADFDFGWKFLKGDDRKAWSPDYDDSGWQAVDLPHDWSIEGPYSERWASGTGYLPGGVGLYRKTFAADSEWKGKLVAIEFDGIYKNSEVWINGHRLGMRPSGYIGFQYDLTRHLSFGKKNVLAVRVDHCDFADSRWYTGSGIYRHVRLTITDRLRIGPWGTYVVCKVLDANKADAVIETTILNDCNQPQLCQVVSRILGPDGVYEGPSNAPQSVEGNGRLIHRQSFSQLPVQLWSVDNPILYSVQTSLLCEGTVRDQTVTVFGARAIRFDPDKGFFLNGQNMKIKGVCLHHDGGPLGAAVPEKVWRKRLESLKEIGCNAIRFSHNPPAPELLDLCDRMGFVVMDEAFDEFTPTKNKWIVGWNKGVPGRDGYGKVFDRWAVRDIQDMVRRDRNHPSVILWSIGNEIDYANDPFSHPALGGQYRPDNPSAENLTQLGRPLVKAVKELDPTRPVTAALANAPMSNAVGFADLLDVVGYNYQENLYAQDHKKYPGRCILGSENSVRYDAWQAVADNPYVSGQFLWIGIDYLGEAAGWPVRSWTGGLFDLCGFKKPEGWFRQSLWSDRPMVYLCARLQRQDRRRGPQSHWNWPARSAVAVFAYSNCPEVTLELNGQTLESRQPTQGSWPMARWEVSFEPGTLTAIGKKDGREVCRYALTTAGPARQIKLIPDCTILAADGKDVCLIECTVTDEKGVLVPDADHSITFSLVGPAKIAGIGSGDPASHEDHKAHTYRVYQGRCLLIAQTQKRPGTIQIAAACDNLKGAEILLEAK
jgi:hypothetical protein